MRPIAFVLSLGFVSLSVGCSAFHGKDVDQNVKPVARAGGPPKAEELVRSLNDNAQRVRSLRSMDVKIDGKFDGTTGGADGHLAYERTYAAGSAPTPPNFRMQAAVVGTTQVDLGSNSQEFWFHVPKAHPSIQFCSYTDFRGGRAALPFPIQPEWIVEALGVAEYDLKGEYTVEQDKSTWQLVEKTVSPQGQTVYKVTSFSKTPAKGNPYPVISRVLLDSTRKNQIYTAAVVRNQTDPRSGAVVPSEVKLIWPKERIEFAMRLDKLEVNVPYSRDDENNLFSRQSLGSLPSVNLARGFAAPASDIRQTGGSGGGR